MEQSPAPDAVEQGRTRPYPPAIDRRRTDYLEGIRAIAAIYVAVNHLVGFYLDEPSRLPTAPWWIREARYLTFGRLSVAAFIVLSGYLLTRPIAQRADVTLAFWPYLKRRVRRIGPPYWAALALSCGAIALLPVLQSPNTPMWRSALPVTPGGVVSHLLLLHDLKPGWLYQLNPPMWSVATEFHIYFFLPLLLVPVWRKWNVAVASGAGVVLGLVPSFIFRESQLLFSPWFLSLFALGMAAASINFSSTASMRAVERDPRWSTASVVLGVIVVAMVVYQKNAGSTLPWVVSEMAFGLWAASFLIVLSRDQSGKGFAGWLVRRLACRPLLWLGSFSYSIYLVHQPVLSIIAGSVAFDSLARQVTYSLLIGMPAVVGISFLFHLAFERPFLRSQRRRIVPAAN